MSVTVDELIKLLDTEGNRYGGATGKPRELNISINGNFCGSIESAKLDGFGDGLVTDVTLEIEAPKMREYYDKEIRDKVIEQIIGRIENARQKYQRLCREQGENEDEVMNIHFRGIMKIIKEEASEGVEEIAEQMKEVGE